MFTSLNAYQFCLIILLILLYLLSTAYFTKYEARHKSLNQMLIGKLFVELIFICVFFYINRWTSDNCEIIWFDDRAKDTSDLNNYVLQSYKAPSSADSVVTQQTVGVELNRHNYVHKMHKLLQIEELTQAHIMSR